MVNKGTLIVLVAGVVLVVGVIAGAVLLNRRSTTAPSPAAHTTETETGGSTTAGENGAAVGGGEEVLCGDGTCSPSETVKTCFSDCASYDVFRTISAGFTDQDTVVVTWETAKPMTSIVDYGTDDTYGGGTKASEDMVTEHKLVIDGVRRGPGYLIRLRGVDADGNEESFEGFGFE